MPRKTINFELDLLNKDIFSRFTVKQFDDATFTVKLKKSGDDFSIAGATCKLFVGVANEAYMQTSGISVSNNSVTITLDRNILQKSGKAYAELEIKDSQGTVTTTTFMFDIDRKLGEGATIPGAVEGFIEKYQKAIEEFKKQTIDAISELQEDYDSLKRIVIDENASANLQNQINTLDSAMDAIQNQVETVINMRLFPRLANEQDDTNRIKRAIEYSTNLLLNNNINTHKILEFPSGRYVISSTIQIPTFIKIKSVGHVSFISKVSGVLFNFFKPADLIIDNSIGSEYPNTKWGIFRGSWLNGIDGNITIVLDKNITKEGTVAINLGNSFYNGGWQNFTGWWLMNDVTIDGFDVGMKYNSYNNFLGKCDKFLITQCNKAIDFVNGGEVRESGEGFTFSNSIFGDNIISVNIDKWADLELAFTNCSFDFTGTVIRTGKNGYYRFTNCHFEGIGYTNKSVEIGGDEASIVYSTGGYWNSPHVFLSGCEFMTIRGKMFKSTEKNGMNLYIEGMSTKGSNGYQKLYELCDDNVDIQVNNFVSDKYLCMIPQRKLNIKRNPCFDAIDDATTINDWTKIDGYNFQTGFTGKTSISTNKFKDGKSVKMVVPSGGVWCQIKSESFACRAGDKILNNFWWLIETDLTTKFARMTVKTTFYDKDSNELSYPSTAIDAAAVTSGSENNVWCRLRHMEQVIAPNKATSFVVTYTINPTSACNLYLSEFFTLVY